MGEKFDRKKSFSKTEKGEVCIVNEKDPNKEPYILTSEENLYVLKLMVLDMITQAIFKVSIALVICFIISLLFGVGVWAMVLGTIVLYLAFLGVMAFVYSSFEHAMERFIREKQERNGE